MTPDALQGLLQQGFTRERWLELLREIIPTAALYLSPQTVSTDGTRARYITQLGEAPLAGNKTLAILEVEADPSVDLARNRAGLRHLAARFIDQDRYHGVFAAFHTPGTNDWRLTFAARESAFDETSGEVTITETAPRRYTYLLGPAETCRTAAERLLSLRTHGGALSIAHVTDAFSVEKLNKEFFGDFTAVFNVIAAELKDRFPKWQNDDATKDLHNQEAQILLNRLLFLYFVQRKGWLHRQRNYLHTHFAEHAARPDSTSYYEKFLFPVFRILATEWRGRDKTTSHLPPDDPLTHDLPFLNGGLFLDELGDEHREESTRRRRALAIRNSTFERVFSGLLERYNFTIREDSPFDQEVAIDPEMLGKIFEELILREEEGGAGGKSKRHDTGSHYTPRPIVHYLCREALTAWLENRTPFLEMADARERIASLLALDAAEGLDEAGLTKLRALITSDDAGALARQLDDLRACDPAVGSGAFPIGLLHELLNLTRLAENRARGRDPAEDDRSWLYDTKKQLIHHTLYGVDIQERATEICKLRLWLSLMVDHELSANPFDCDRRSFQQALRQLEPLPNLDYKIRRANSLVDSIHGHPVELRRLSGEPGANRWLLQLTGAKLAFFNARTKQEKRDIHCQIYEALAQLGRIELARVKVEKTGLGITVSDDEARQLAELHAAEAELGRVLKFAESLRSKKTSAAQKDELLEQLHAIFADRERPTFVWQLDFAEVFQRRRVKREGRLGVAADRVMETVKGFDIVIGNPPYVRQEKLKDLKPLLAVKFSAVFVGTADIYVCFYELALQLLCEQGCISFITSNKWYRVEYGRKLRGYLSKNVTLLHVIDFGDAPLFTAVAYPTIVVARKCEPQPSHSFHALNWNPKTPKRELADFAKFYAASSRVINQVSLSDEPWRFNSGNKPDFVDQLRSVGTPLKEFVGSRVYRGITTGLNDAFVINSETHDAILKKNPSAAEVLKPYARGRDIQRWAIEPEPQWLIFTRRGIDISEYTAVRDYLSKYRPKLTPGAPGGRKPGSYEWYEIQDNIAYWQQFARPKIVSTKISLRPTFALDESGYYLGNTAYFFPVQDEGHFLLGLLNSKLSFAYAKRVFVEKQNDWYEVQPAGLEFFPVPPTETNQRAAIEHLVEYLLCLHRQESVRESTALFPRDPLMAEYFEQWIDAMVYELFFPEELHSAQTGALRFFDLHAAARLPKLDTLDESDRLPKLRQHFEKLYDPSHRLRGALYSLQSLELVRTIEGCQ